MAHEHGPHTCYCPNCGHTLTADTGVRCNTWICPVCGTQMRALETGENRETRLSKGVAIGSSVATNSLACPVCGYPIPEPGPPYNYPESLNQVRCAYCGTISEVIQDVTVPTSVVVGLICFFAGGILMPPLLQAIKSGATALERVTRERIK